jgi:hypothetical protein
MIDLLKRLGGLLVGVFRSHAAREAEMAFLLDRISHIGGRADSGCQQTAMGAVGYDPEHIRRFAKDLAVVYMVRYPLQSA